MSFFHTVVLFFALALAFGWMVDRQYGARLDQARHALYTVMGLGLVLVILWTLLQMILALPAVASIFPLEACFLGVIFALGSKGGYRTLKERSKLKKLGTKKQG
ncbi:hypothetical protein GCM10007939_01990 [Amylibacter marinus]|uniref:Uncharacterized protein n=1 Tax=Amylibacter marinus TaxID=1475483 RepID=A0ABQ5VR79_9RHOB|nr:hypothetical protein [Amylibacter marinus]GLQ33916.1 hypothetical protein GCM10007939_01990 [Amylibacter marinus]